ncbi:MAG: 3-phosphoshikimate 1-carboxyvinyltransferase [Candidatus Micrarchaeia archaeon]
MNVGILPSVVTGSVRAPSSKAISHRALVCAALAGGKSTVRNFLDSDDTNATAEALKAFGARITRKQGAVEIRGATLPLRVPSAPINCGLSGSTIRFIIPLAALADGRVTLTGEGSLLRRPMGELAHALHQLGVSCETTGGFPPVTVRGFGSIPGGKCALRGDVSSQFVSGLLFAAPLAASPTAITLTTPLESKPYVELTLEAMRKFGVRVKASRDFRSFRVSPQQYRPARFVVEGDWSNAAFLLAAGTLAGGKKGVRVLGLEKKTKQGDSAIYDVIKRMGGEVFWKGKALLALPSALRAATINAANIPDLVPILAVLACFAEGTTRITHAGRLRLKESNRLAAMATELSKMGAGIRETRDGLVVKGPCALHGAVVDSHADHRIAMSLAVAALRAQGKTTIRGAECVAKSYPRFWRDLKFLKASIRPCA